MIHAEGRAFLEAVAGEGECHGFPPVLMSVQDSAANADVSRCRAAAA
jgi:hypothetical protein